MKYVSSENILLGALEDHGIENIGRFKDWGMRKIRHALQDIGIMPEVNLVSVKATIEDDGSIAKPDEMLDLNEIMLVENGGRLVRPAYVGERQKLQYGVSGKFFNSSLPGLASQRGCWFFVSGNPGNYSCALIAYTSIIRDEKGYPLVPWKAESAIYSYLNASILRRKRNQGANVTTQEIQDAEVLWARKAGSAKGAIKLGDKPEIEWRSFDRFLNPGMTKGPNRHL